jgi:hypothetical protein
MYLWSTNKTKNLKNQIMTQVQSIQANINDAEANLIRVSKVVPADVIEKYHIDASIRYYKKEINQLKRCLNRAIELSK